MNVDIKNFTDAQLQDELKRRQEELSKYFRVSADARGLHLHASVVENTQENVFDYDTETVNDPDFLVVCEQLSNGSFRLLGATHDTDTVLPHDAGCSSMRNLCETIDRGFSLVAFPVWKSTMIGLTAPPDKKR